MNSRRAERNGLVFVLTCLVTLSAPCAWAGTGGKLPKLTAETRVREVSGRIVESSRGRSGPVQLILELEGGAEMKVMVAPDALCDELGLALQAGEELTVIGYELSGESPLLVARSVVVAGRRVDVRDARGVWVRPSGLGDPAAARGEKPVAPDAETEGDKEGTAPP